MEERNITALQVLSAVTALTMDELDKLRDENKDLAIIDENEGYAVIICRDKNTIKVITVIDEADIWVKDGTNTKRLKGDE